MLCNGNFTRDEWNNLLHLFDISHFSSTCCIKNLQLDKLLHNCEEDSRSQRRRKSCVQVATSSDEYIFFCCDKFFPRINSDCTKKSRDADSSVEDLQQDECWTKLIRRSVDVSSATQGYIPWRVDGKAAVRPVSSRIRRFKRLRQSWGWNLVLQRGTRYGRSRWPKQYISDKIVKRIWDV